MLFLFRDVGSLHLSTFYRRIFFRSPGSHFHDKSSVQGRYSFVKLGESARFGFVQQTQPPIHGWLVRVGCLLFIMYVDMLGMYPDAPCYGNSYLYIILRSYECSCGHLSPFT